MSIKTPWRMGADGAKPLERVCIFSGGKARVEAMRGAPDPLVLDGVKYMRTSSIPAIGGEPRFVYSEESLSAHDKGEATIAFMLDAERKRGANPRQAGNSHDQDATT
jgi:hypothetical protein